jgi:hypothetical protein
MNITAYNVNTAKKEPRSANTEHGVDGAKMYVDM